MLRFPVDFGFRKRILVFSPQVFCNFSCLLISWRLISSQHSPFTAQLIIYTLGGSTSNIDRFIPIFEINSVKFRSIVFSLISLTSHRDPYKVSVTSTYTYLNFKHSLDKTLIHCSLQALLVQLFQLLRYVFHFVVRRGLYILSLVLFKTFSIKLKRILKSKP